MSGPPPLTRSEQGWFRTCDWCRDKTDGSSVRISPGETTLGDPPRPDGGESPGTPRPRIPRVRPTPLPVTLGSPVLSAPSHPSSTRGRNPPSVLEPHHLGRVGCVVLRPLKKEFTNFPSLSSHKHFLTSHLGLGGDDEHQTLTSHRGPLVVTVGTEGGLGGAERSEVTEVGVEWQRSGWSGSGGSRTFGRDRRREVGHMPGTDRSGLEADPVGRRSTPPGARQG